MLLCMFIWPIQSHLAFTSGTSFRFRSGPRDVAIQCETMEGAKLFSYTGEEYGWLTGAYETDQRHARVVSESGEKAVIRRIYRKIGDNLFTGGVVDPLKYTRVSVTFELDDAHVLDDNSQFEELAAWVESVVQRFVDMYRLVSQEYDITRPRIDDAPIIEVWVADDYSFDASGEEIGFNLHKQQWSISEATKPMHLKGNMIEQDFHRLRILLHSGEDAPLHERLILDSREQLFLRGDHDLSIVIAETAFEAFLQSHLLGWCAANGITDLPKRKGQGVKQVNYVDAIESGQVTDNLGYVQTLSGVNLKGGVEHNNWFTHAYKKRNAIVHRGTRGATQDDALKALDSVIAYRERIMNILVHNTSHDPIRAAGYNFYFSLDPDLPKDQWQKVNEKLISAPQFKVDTSHLKPGTTYYVYATSVNGWGVESPPSDVITNMVSD